MRNAESVHPTMNRFGGFVERFFEIADMVFHAVMMERLVVVAQRGGVVPLSAG